MAPEWVALSACPWVRFWSWHLFCRPGNDAGGEVKQVSIDLAQVLHLVFQLCDSDPQLVLTTQHILGRSRVEGWGAQGGESSDILGWGRGKSPPQLTVPLHHTPLQPHPSPWHYLPFPLCCTLPHAAALLAPGSWAPTPAEEAAIVTSELTTLLTPPKR